MQIQCSGAGEVTYLSTNLERGLDAEFVAEQVRLVCVTEVMAFKPGNVSIESGGYGMCAKDFIASAAAIAAVIAAPSLRVGDRVHRAVEATQRAVGCNTNLGIVLLVAPLVQAVLQPSRETQLRPRLEDVLRELDLDDALLAFRAIRLAAPGGLGNCTRHDVHADPAVTLLEAMEEAQNRDRIAFQYASGYQDIFAFGVARFRKARSRYGLKWALVSTYLGFLSHFPDTHVARKFGPEAAASVCREAAWLDRVFLQADAPERLLPYLREMDRSLKAAGMNPGTSADLTVASALATTLEDALKSCFDDRECRISPVAAKSGFS